METKSISLQDLIDSVLPFTRTSPAELEIWAKAKLEEPAPPPLSKRIPKLSLIVKDTEYVVTVEEIRAYFASKEKPKEYVGDFAEPEAPTPEPPVKLATAPKPKAKAKDKRATGRKARPG
jgi:hypothetical protein